MCSRSVIVLVTPRDVVWNSPAIGVDKAALCVFARLSDAGPRPSRLLVSAGVARGFIALMRRGILTVVRPSRRRLLLAYRIRVAFT